MASGLGIAGAEAVLCEIADLFAASCAATVVSAGLIWEVTAIRATSRKGNSPVCSRSKGYTSTIFRIRAPNINAEPTTALYSRCLR